MLARSPPPSPPPRSDLQPLSPPLTPASKSSARALQNDLPLASEQPLEFGRYIVLGNVPKNVDDRAIKAAFEPVGELRGILLRFLKDHGAVVLALYDARQGASVLRFVHSNRFFNNVELDAHIISPAHLRRIIGSTAFASDHEGQLVVSAQLDPRALQNVISSFGSIRSFTSIPSTTPIPSSPQPPPPGTNAVLAEYDDVRAVKSACTSLNGHVIMGTRIHAVPRSDVTIEEEGATQSTKDVESIPVRTRAVSTGSLQRAPALHTTSSDQDLRRRAQANSRLSLDASALPVDFPRRPSTDDRDITALFPPRKRSLSMESHRKPDLQINTTPSAATQPPLPPPAPHYAPPPAENRPKAIHVQTHGQGPPSPPASLDGHGRLVEEDIPFPCLAPEPVVLSSPRTPVGPSTDLSPASTPSTITANSPMASPYVHSQHTPSAAYTALRRRHASAGPPTSTCWLGAPPPTSSLPLPPLHSPTTPSRHEPPERNRIDLERIAAGRDTRTTVMVKNIPNKMVDTDLIAYLDRVVPRRYDFLYLRMDFSNACNVGYAFVNFVDVKDLLRFARACLGQKWNMFSSEKVLQMSYANYQGKEALVEKFKNSVIMDVRESWRPKIFYSSGPNQGLPEPFPAPTLLRRKERLSAGMYGTLHHHQPHHQPMGELAATRMRSATVGNPMETMRNGPHPHPQLQRMGNVNAPVFVPAMYGPAPGQGFGHVHGQMHGTPPSSTSARF